MREYDRKRGKKKKRPCLQAANEGWYRTRTATPPPSSSLLVWLGWRLSRLSYFDVVAIPAWLTFSVLWLVEGVCILAMFFTKTFGHTR